MIHKTNFVSKQRFKEIESEFGDRIDEEAREKIEEADEEARMRLYINSEPADSIEKVKVFNNPEELNI